jgi:hypothetical protein
MQSTFSDMPRSVNEQGQLIEDPRTTGCPHSGVTFDRRGDYSGNVRHRTPTEHTRP